MPTIDEIIEEGAGKIKQILLNEAKKIKPFPKSYFGVRDRRYTAIDSEEFPDSEDFTSQGIARPKPGILVFDAHKPWMENSYVFMLPNGLYKFGAGMFRVSSNGKPTNELKSAPNWASRREERINYLIHGEKAFLCLMKIVAEQ